MCTWDPYHQKSSGGLGTCLGLGGRTGRNHVFKQKSIFCIVHRRSHEASNLLFQCRFYSFLLFFLDVHSGRAPWTPATHATDVQLQGHTRPGTCARALIRLLTCILPYCYTLHAWEAISCTPHAHLKGQARDDVSPAHINAQACNLARKGCHWPVLHNVWVPTAPPEIFHPHRAHRRQRLTHVRHPLLV